jgi:hypothetical protein
MAWKTAPTPQKALAIVRKSASWKLRISEKWAPGFSGLSPWV